MFAQRLESLHPYVPGEQPKDREYIKLNANENPYPPSPAVAVALSSFDAASLRLYPDPESVQLKMAIATLLNSCGGVLYRAGSVKKNTPDSDKYCLPFEVTADMVFCGNGSDEVLSFLFYALFDGKKPLVIPEHTYSFYPVYADFYGIPLKRVPLKNDFTLAVDDLLATDSCGVIFANPNAPTGIALSLDKLEYLLERCPKDRAVVVDEAYVDFGGETALPLLTKYRNLVIVRTFSKSMSFAGMRLGYALANPDIITAFTRVKNSFNHFPVDALCQKVGIAACTDSAYYGENCRRIMNDRDEFATLLRSLGWTVLPSAANFVLASKNGVAGQKIYECVKESGILIRHFNTKGISDFVRVSIGTHEHMNRLSTVMTSL